MNISIVIKGKDEAKVAFATAKEGALLLKQAQIENAQAATKLKEETIKLKQAQIEGSQASVRIKEATFQHNTSLNQQKLALDAAKMAMQNSKQSTDNLSSSVQGAGKSASDFEQTASNMSAHSIVSFGLLEEAGRKVMDGLLAIGEKSIGVGKEVVTLAGDYQENQLKLQFLTTQVGDSAQDTANRMASFNKEAIQVGKDSSFSSKEAMAAMAELAQMGYKTEEINKIIGQSANAAMVNNEGLTQATDTLTSTMHGFGKTADQSKEVLDLMTRASQLGKLSFDDFGKAAENVGLVSKSAGQSMEGTTAELLALTNTGMDAARASQTLRFALTQIEKPSKAASEMMDGLGISYFDSNGKMKDFASIVDIVNARTKNMTDEQRLYVTQTLFSKNGALAYNAALQAQATEVLPDHTTKVVRGTEALRYNEEQLKHSADTMDKATDIIKTGFNFQMKNMQGSIEEAMISVGTALLPGLTSVIKLVNDNVKSFIDWEQSTHTVGNALVGIATIITNVLGVAIKIASPIVETLVNFFVKQLIPAVISFGEYFQQNILPPLLSLANVVIKQVLPPLLQFGSWIFVTLIPQLLKLADALWKGLQPAFQVVVSIIQAAIPIIQQIAAFIEGNLIRIIRSLVDNFNKYLAPAIANFAKFVTEKVIPAVQDMWRWFSDKVLPVLDQIVGVITGTVIPVLSQWISFLVSVVIPILWQWWTIIANFLKPIIEAIVTVISTVLIPAFKAIGDWITSTGIPVVTALARNFQDNFMPIIKGVSDFIGGTFGNAISFAWNLLQSLGHIVTEWVIPAFGHLWDFISTYILPIFSTIANVVGTVIGGAFTGLGFLLNNIVVPAFNFLVSVVSGIINFIKGALSTVANFFVDVINTPINLINGVINALKNLPGIGMALGWVPTLPTLGYVNFFAGGTNNAPGGPAVVGENGPELMKVFGKVYSVASPTLLANLPKGSQVTPVNQNNSSVQSSNSKSEVHYHTHNYTFSANYKYQERDSLIQDVKSFQLLNSKT